MANPYPFRDKVIVVSGASRGSGLALSRYLLTRGAKVSMAATSEDNLKQAIAGIEQDIPDAKDRVIYFPTDVTKPDEVKVWIEGTVAKWGELDGAANVAAKMNKSIHPIEDLDLEELKEMLDVNVIGTFNCIKYEMKNMKPGGSIVNCGSQQVKYASGNMSAYAASKNAIRGLSQSAAFEGGAKYPKNPIRVNLLCPGCIDTDMIKQPLHLPNGTTWTMTEDDSLTSIIKRYSKPEEIAASIAFLLGDESKFMTKQEIYVDGGWMEANYIGDSSVDPMARFSTPTEVNAFLDVFHKHGHDQLDTAAVYSPGAPYTSEPRIGAVLAGSRFKIDTKADWFEGHTKESVSRDIENSLKNLQIDQINIYYLQLPERVHPLKPVLEVLDQAHRDGKIKAWGISNYRADEVQKTIDICEENDFVKPSVYQGHYNPVVRGGEKELFPLLRKHGIAFYAYSPGAGGFFAQKHKNPEPMSRFSGSTKVGSVYVAMYVKDSIEAAVGKALQVAAKYNIGGHAAALRWTAHHGILEKQYGDGVIIGASSLSQLEENLNTVEEGPLPEELAAAIDQVYQEVGDEIKYHL
ncbi:hypothetical protein ACLX1H_000944 [Fusarium chlamydosporum]